MIWQKTVKVTTLKNTNTYKFKITIRMYRLRRETELSPIPKNDTKGEMHKTQRRHIRMHNCLFVVL